MCCFASHVYVSTVQDTDYSPSDSTFSHGFSSGLACYKRKGGLPGEPVVNNLPVNVGTG